MAATLATTIMNRQLRRTDEARRSNDVAVRPKPGDLAMPTQSEMIGQRVVALGEAFDLLCDAANSFDQRRVHQAIAAATDLLPLDGDMGNLVSDLHQALVDGSQFATRAEVAETAARLIGAYPNFSKSEGRLYGAALVEDIAAQQPTRLALEMAARHVRRTFKFVPAVPEVLDALTSAQLRIDRAWDVVFLLEQRWAQANARREKLVTDHERWLAERVVEYQEAVASGDDLRRFPAEIVAAATTSPDEDEVPF
jgi:hypothetical protein